MSTKENQELMEREKQELTTEVEAPLGYEEDDSNELIIPRLKVMNALSPEVRDRDAEEGTIINSISKADKTDGVFVPVFFFKNNILWRDRADGGGIECIARDAKVGTDSTGVSLACSACLKCEFDNSKEGRDAVPTCTKYLNFFGFFNDDKTPIILSFSRTNYKEGKQMYTTAKLSRENMFNNQYTLGVKKLSKNGNEWFVVSPKLEGPTSEEDRILARQMYDSYRNTMATTNYDMDDTSAPADAGPSVKVEDTEF